VAAASWSDYDEQLELAGPEPLCDGPGDEPVDPVPAGDDGRGDAAADGLAADQ
jgi:hypothetical protein